MLNRLTERYIFEMKIFTNNILWYSISMFFFSRLFYIISQWNDSKYIDNAAQFFVATDYDFSLF
jgi:prolipoprotein diacylglyceryltransferase